VDLFEVVGEVAVLEGFVAFGAVDPCALSL